MAVPSGRLDTDGLRISAHAGINGLARVGRWTVVGIVLENTGTDLTGDLVIDAGPSRLIRAVVLPSPARKRIETYIRVASSDVDRVRVTFVSGGRELNTIDAPVRLVSEDSALVLCAPASTGAAQDPRCTASPEASALPRSWRGYDAVDEVIGPVSAVPGLDDEQRTAIKRWQVLRAHEWIVPPVARRPDAPRMLTQTRAVVILYTSLFVLILVASRRLARRATVFYATLVAAVALGSLAAMAQGRVGPGSAIVLSDAAVVRAAEGAEGALVTVAGVAEFPSYGSFDLGPAFSDGIVSLHGEGAPLRFAEDGESSLSGVFGKGQRVRFDLEGFSDLRTVEITRAPGMLRVRNASSGDLTECELPSGFSPSAFPRIRPGASVEARQTTSAEGAALTCRFTAQVPSLESSGARVAHHGAAVLVFALRDAGTAR